MSRSIFVRRLLAAIMLGLWTASAGAIGTTPPSWKPRETVTSTPLTDYQHMIGADRSLAYDHHGNPGIAFFGGVGGLRYARRVPGVGWVHTAVDLPNGADVGRHPSLAYDRYERPAISYYDAAFTGGGLTYARFNGSVWQIETVEGINARYTSLAFDMLGRPAIAYQDGTNTSLKFVQDTDGDFSLLDETPVTVNNQADEGNYASLVFDTLNRPMIAHQDATNSDLRFSVQEPGIGWVTTTVDSTGFIGYYPSIAIEPDTGFPAIAYSSEFGFSGDVNLYYAAWDGDSWNPTQVDLNHEGRYPSLAFDPADGNPAIAYYAAFGADLKLAWHNGSSWQTQPVDDGVGVGGNVGLTPSLAFNNEDFGGTGFPSIAYFDNGINGAGKLYFIEDPPAVPEPASMTLLVIGFAAGAGWRRRRLRG